MKALDANATVAVIGAGTMGAGIAQVAAQAGHPVLLYDAKDGAAARGVAGIATALDRQVEKGKLPGLERDAIFARLHPVADLADLAPSALVIEAIVEDLAIKRQVFAQVEAVVDGACILATNTSSISITAMANGLARPARLVGMHFFNPAPLMALVEVVSGLATDPGVADVVHATAARWGKSPVRAKSTPGFIVNRVARPFYAEGLRVLQEGGADIASIDALAREAGGFRMGPFELMDLIGHDVNFAVTQSVWRAFFHDPRFLPSLIQQDLVDGGWLGRKSGRGFYDYAPGAVPPQPRQMDPMEPPETVALSAALADHPLGRRLKDSGAACHQDVLDGLVLRVGTTLVVPGDGRTAAIRAQQTGQADLVLFDTCLDFATARRIGLTRAPGVSDDSFAQVAGLFQALGMAVTPLADIPGQVLGRLVAMLVNEAMDAVYHGVASASDVDVAMTKGVNYPLGPLAWGERWGLGAVLTVLDNMHAITGEDRYRPSTLLRQKVALSALS